MPRLMQGRRRAPALLASQSAPVDDGGRSRYAYIVGTPYCGSTVLGQALGAHSSMRYLGEVDRLVQHAPTLWAEELEPTCHICELRGEPCPVWTPARIEEAREMPYGKLMSYFNKTFGGSALVDGSKHPSWLRSVFADQAPDPDRTVALLTVRSPFAFSDSYRTRSGGAAWEAANLWRDLYYDALRLLTASGLPFLVVRYEQFALHPESVLRPACALLGVEFEPEMLQFQSRPSHDVGGNYSAHAVSGGQEAGFSASSFRDRLPDTWAKSAEQSQVYWGKPFGGWVDEKWQARMTADDVEQVLQTPGLGDLANLLGYQLSREIAAWQRREVLAAENPAQAGG